MKLVYYIPSLFISGGLERIITFKANYLAENYPDYQITIITSEQLGKKPYFNLSPKIKHIDINVPFDQPYNQSKLTKAIKFPYRYMLFKHRLSKELKELRADIVISTLRRELYFINSIKDGSVKIAEFHVTRHSYNIGSRKSTNIVINLIKKTFNQYYINQISKLGKFVILTNEEKHNWPELNNIKVIGNPIVINTDKVSNCSSTQVIAVGRHSYQKGFDLLIKSWNLIAQKYPNWILKIYGDGNTKEIIELINQLKLSNNCILEHSTPNIVEKYLESSIFVLSSRFEGFGLVITEAMSCGVPPVSFACPCGPKDIIKDGEDGLLVENGNIEQLAEKICYLIENEDVRKEMGKKARINVERFKIENIVKQWDDLFKELLSQKEKH